MDPWPGGERVGATKGRKDPTELPGLAGVRLSQPSQALCGLGGGGPEVTRVVLSLSSFLSTGVPAEGDLRPWQPCPE